MLVADRDPHIFFVAERTLLARLRTGLMVMALGFVVVRFGLFLHLLSAQPAAIPGHREFGVSGWLGVVFVVVSAVAILAATLQHRRYALSLPESALRDSDIRGFALLLSAVVGMLGLLLAVCLAISQA